MTLMELNLDKTDNTHQIRSYEPGTFVVNDQVFHQSIIVSATELLPWRPDSFSELTPEKLAELLKFKPSVVILGTGTTQIFPAANFLAPFVEKSVGIEIMSTAAACRTFNVLLAEGRNVTAGLLVH